MGLYVTTGIRGAGPYRKRWTPGDPGQPNQADSKQELLAFCPPPEPLACPDPDCDRMRYAWAHLRKQTYYTWSMKRFCQRCQVLRHRHGLSVAGLIAMWEAQGRQCYRPECSKVLNDPRIVIVGGRDARVDHDHNICPQKEHSCERCRRGLACNICNTHALSIRTTGSWVLPQADGNLHRWLEFLGAEDRDRLRKALTLFPEQPARKPSRRKPHEDAEVIPLFPLEEPA